jgi:uncharacterized GH25 family protein
MNLHLRAWAVVAAMISSPSVYAHEVTLFPTLDLNRIHILARYGDPGQYERIERIKLISLDAIIPDQHTVSLTASVQESSDALTLYAELPVPTGEHTGTWILASSYDNGFYIHASDGHAIATTLQSYPAAKDSAHYFKFSKALLRVGTATQGYDHAIGHTLEIIPHDDPFSNKNQLLSIEVRFAGHPLANAEVEIGDETTPTRIHSLITNAGGMVQVPLDHAGWYRLAVTHRTPSKYPDLFQEDDFTASLVFQR